MKALTQVCCSVLILFSTSALSKDLPYPFRIYTHTYNVHGETIEGFYDNVSKQARLHGFTDRYGELHWNYNFYLNDSCDFNLVNLTLNITYPTLDLTKTSDKIAESATCYLDNLKEHELAHCTITIKNFTDAYQQLINSRDSNCSDAMRLADDSLDLLEEENDDLEVFTSWGTALVDNKQFIYEEYLPYCLGM